MFTKFRMKEEKGFTLIELLIVVAIIGILAAIAIPQFGAYRKRGYNAAANSDLRSIRTSEEAMMADYSEYGESTASIGGDGAAVTGPTAMTLTGGKSTSAPISISLSSNVLGVATAVGTGGDVARIDFTATVAHTSGDTYFSTTNGTLSGSSALYRKVTTTAPTAALLVDTSTGGRGGVTLGAAGNASSYGTSGADTTWIQM